MIELSIETFENILAHHGIEGQKWGVKNGPPYPLNPKDYSRADVPPSEAYSVINIMYKANKTIEKLETTAEKKAYLNTILASLA